MGGKGSAPAAPDLSSLAAASEESARIWARVQDDQLQWAKEIGQQGADLMQEVLGVQIPQMQEAFRQAQMDRQRYEDTYLPIEQNLIDEFKSYDSPERREQEAATAQADIAASFDAQRENALQRLDSYGIDVSQTRSMAMDRGVRAQQASMQALAANRGRQQVEQMGRALRGEAINIGRGLPGQVGMTQGIVNQTAGGAANNFGGLVSSMAGAYSPAMQAGQMSQAGYQQAAGIQGQQFNMNLDSWNATTAAEQASWNTAINAAGAVGGMIPSDPKLKEGRTPVRASAAEAISRTPVEEYSYKASSGYDDGARHVGPMADDVRDEMGIGDGTAIPMQDMLMAHHAAIGELTAALKNGGLLGDGYVIPPEVVRAKGSEHFDKIVDKYKSGGDYEKTRALPARKA